MKESTWGVIKSFLVNKDSFTYSYLRKCIINEGGLMRVTTNYSIKDFLKDIEKEGKIVMKYTDDDIKIFVVNSNYIRKEKINKIKNIIYENKKRVCK